jgi:hypothetical protein
MPRTTTPPPITVLERLGGALLPQLDILTERLVAAIYDSEPAYAQQLEVTEDDLRASIAINLERALRVLIGELPLEGGPHDPARETGTRRAQQRMPLEAVLRAYRLGGQVIWDALVEACRNDPDGDPHELMESASWVWKVIDAHSLAVSEEYRREEERLRSRNLRQRQAVLDALVGGAGNDPAFAREAGRILDLPPGRPMVCIVALIETPGTEPLRSPQEALGAAGFDSVWQTRGGVELGLASLEGHSADALLGLLRTRTCGRVGVSPAFDGFAEVSTAYRLAEVSARTLPECAAAVAFLDDCLPEALVASSPEIIPRLLEQTVQPLLELPAADRQALLDTLEAVLANDGSPTRAAADLYCHRNTVMYRLQRIEELTGRGFGAPRDKLLWTLALAALGQRPELTTDH